MLKTLNEKSTTSGIMKGQPLVITTTPIMLIADNKSIRKGISTNPRNVGDDTKHVDLWTPKCGEPMPPPQKP